MSWFGRSAANNASDGSRAPQAPQRTIGGHIVVPPAAAAKDVKLHQQPAQNTIGGSVVQGDIRHAENGVAYQTYADVPRFLRVMTTGENALYALSPADAKHLVVIELAGRKAALITSPAGCDNQTLIESVRGALIADRFVDIVTVTAPENVILEIYSASVTTEAAKGGGRSGNVYMGTVHQWIEYAVKNRATDIHIETRGTVGKVRFRIDGEVEEMCTANKGTYAANFVEKCMGALFNNEQQRKSGSGSQFEPTSSLYCMVPYSEIPGHTLKLRFQSLKGNDGPKTVLRLLPVNENASTLSYDELGYEVSQQAQWRMAMNTPSGAVLIAGVTGSGKSTTMKTFIELNPNAPFSAIYTVEDPVEYPIKHTHQMPIQRDLSNPAESVKVYAETIAALVRADPDVVMLGEIRDRYSASAAQQMTETGHMALGTVHAHLLSGIVPRLVNPEIGMNRDVLTAPNMLTLLVYQALVPRLCPHCAHDTAEAEERFPDVAEVSKHIRALGLDTHSFRWKCLGGCNHCGNRGTVGQTVVAEMLMPDEEWLRPIREGRDADAVEAYRSCSDRDLTSSNMDGKTVFEHTLLKAYRGHVDARQCSRFDNFNRFINRFGRMA
jgi:type II secretory ATPase GspE/PulE/Tfp pilus assembly ATPase PilB-like protein